MTPFLRLGAILLLATSLYAEDQPITDDGLPLPFDAGVADQLLTHSPFTRIVNLEETLQLTGVAYVDGKPVATFVNRATKEHVTVSEEPNPQGWRITEAIPGAEPEQTVVHVMIGPEEITMHYGDAQLTPGASKNGNPSKYVARASGDSRSKGDDHIRTSSFLGDNGKELYASLSHDSRDKLKEAVHAYVEKHPDNSQDQNSAYAQKLFTKLKATDEKTGAVPSTKSNIKSGKPSKNK